MKYALSALLVGAVLLLGPAASWGQDAVATLLTKAERAIPRGGSAPADEAMAQQGGAGLSGFYDLRSLQERNRLIAIVVLAVAALAAHIVVLRYITIKTQYSTAHIVNATGLVFIIFGTIILVMLSDTEQQLAAATGVLGAVAGYLFGATHAAGVTGGGERRP